MTSEAWATLWDLLCQRFGREPSSDLSAFYLDELEARLTDEEIRTAVQRILYRNTYWPSPREMVQAAGGEKIETDWQRVLQLRQSQVDREAYPDDMERPSPAAMRALRSLGGLEVLKGASGRDFLRYRKAFREAYEALSEEPEASSLPQVTDESRRLVAAASEEAT